MLCHAHRGICILQYDKLYNVTKVFRLDGVVIHLLLIGMSVFVS